MVHINSDGVKIAVYEYNRECKSENGVITVLFLHGWPLSGLIFEYQINLLVELGYHVVAMDFRGFGNSDAPVCGYDYNQMARDVYAVIKSLGLSCITLAGFSMGGAVALRYIRLFKGYQIKKLILLAAAAPFFTKRPDIFPYGIDKREVDEMIEKANKDRPELCRKFVEDKLFATHKSPAVRDWFTRIAESASGLGTIRAACALKCEDGSGDLKCVNLPTFIIRGEKDTVVPPEVTDYQHREIPRSTLFSLKHSAHAVFYDELENFNNYFIKAVLEP